MASKAPPTDRHPLTPASHRCRGDSPPSPAAPTPSSLAALSLLRPFWLQCSSPHARCCADGTAAGDRPAVPRCPWQRIPERQNKRLGGMRQLQAVVRVAGKRAGHLLPEPFGEHVCPRPTLCPAQLQVLRRRWQPPDLRGFQPGWTDKRALLHAHRWRTCTAVAGHHEHLGWLSAC